MKHAQTRSRQTRERILEAALKLAETQDYRSITTEKIADTAHVAKGTVFAHFGDRTNLLAALGLRQMEKLLESVEPEGTPLDVLMQYYCPLLAFFVETPDFARLFIDPSSLPDGPMSDDFSSACHKLEDLVRTQIQLLTEDVEDIDLLSAGAQAFFLQAVTYRLAGWIETNEAAQKRMQNALMRWLP